MAPNLENIQGDLFNRGFPKVNETFYFFSIAPGKEKEFTKALAALGKSGQISSLKKVLADWVEVDASAKDEIIAVSNALIAFTKLGLEKIQSGLGGESLGLDKLEESDPAFFQGMAEGRNDLADPPKDKWDPLFNSTTPIHGALKVAGGSSEMVDSKLNDIKSILGHPTLIINIDGQSLPTTANSRVDGHVRPKEQGLNGREHFGFEDGVSQPLLRGINTDAEIAKDEAMESAQDVITVTATPPETTHVPPSPVHTVRPKWMIEGSFLVFRKLEQDVAGFNDLVNKNFSKVNCLSAEHCGAKIMGRWKSGAPIVLNPNEDNKKDPLARNDFTYNNTPKSVCPLGAHIRKMNPRNGSESTRNARIIRNGIPYGSEFSVDPAGKRGLLFACYQSSIHNGFRFIQMSWSNNERFPVSKTGHDPFSAQTGDGKVYITMHDANDKAMDPGFGKFEQLVKMKGGEYFFVPPISALSGILGSA